MANAPKRLSAEYANMKKTPNPHFSAQPSDSNIQHWTFEITGPEGTYYEKKTYQGTLDFPNDYPFSPPKMVFTKIPFHPNVYIDGKVCISILHAGTDETGYESQSLRWSPVQNITSILMSVLSLLSDPNPDSAANLEASQLYRKDKDAFKAKVQSMA